VALAAVASLVTLPPGIAQTATENTPRAPPPARPGDAPAGARVNLNSAPAAELQTLPGVGPALAARIVAWRSEHGPFRTPGELVQVRGIGPNTAARLAPRVITSP
jgi:competence protein ComEA